ncbi:MAG: type II toxin-antitoxin system VapB family antitoxin [Nannocystaceae bacterium]
MSKKKKGCGRTNIVIDYDLVDEAMRLFDQQTMRGAVHSALWAAVKPKKQANKLARKLKALRNAAQAAGEALAETRPQ